MEDTLRGVFVVVWLINVLVLILVLMEDTLRVRDIVSDSCDLSLNPCFNGRYSQRIKILVV